MAYDANRNRMVVFGGETGGTALFDTWEYDGTIWSQVVTDGAPESFSAMSFDMVRGRCVLLGVHGYPPVSDTWEWDGARWQQVFTADRPPPVTAGAMAYDLLRGVSVVCGGLDVSTALGLDRTWQQGGAGATTRTFGIGCVGGGLPPILVPQTVPSLGATAAVRVDWLPIGGGIVVMIAGLSDQTWSGAPLPRDLGPIGLTGCRAYTSVDAAVVLLHTSGTVTWSQAVPNHPALAGLRLFLQALSLDAAAPRLFPAALSGAAELRVY